MSIERSIQQAKIQETGEVIKNLDSYFEDRKVSFHIRQEYNRNKINFRCLNCGQKLVVAQSIKHNIYLKHPPNSNYCELKDENLSNRELDTLNNILVAKESERHITLKNKIGELLKPEKNVSNVRIDDHFIFNDKGKKRRPDVYCKYLDKEIVFEIQLSQLSQRYILGRRDFYKAKGIYLIWILDTINITDNNSLMGLDIKYLSFHQNYFRFNDKLKNFNLMCDYKYSHLFESNNKLIYKWNTVNITLDKLKFDVYNVEVYFHNFSKDKEEKELIQKRNSIAIEKKREQREIERKRENAVSVIDHFLNDVANQKEKGYDSDFEILHSQYGKFSELELEILNDKLNLNESGRHFKWVENASIQDLKFLEFILNPTYINLDINKLDKSNNNIFHYLFSNNKIPHIHNKEEFLKLFFKIGYKLKENDINTLHFYLTNKKQIDSFVELKTIYIKASMTPKWLINKLFEPRARRAILIIESFMQKNLIGFNYSNNKWLNLAQNSIQYYPEYWSYILTAMKYSNLFENILLNDRKKNLAKKISAFNQSTHVEDREFKYLFMQLYADL